MDGGKLLGCYVAVCRHGIIGAMSRNRRRVTFEFWPVVKVTGAALGVIAVVCLCVVALNRGSQPSAAGDTSSNYDPQALLGTHTPDPTPASVPDIPNGANVVVVGDSWSSGYGADVAETQNWASVAATNSGWNLTKFSLGGAGYTKAGKYADYSGDFTYCLQQAAKRVDPSTVSIVVIQGGINDTDDRKKPGPLTVAFTSTVKEAKSLFPNATVIALGPMPPTPAYELAVKQVDEILASAALRSGVPYIDANALGWFSASNRNGLVRIDLAHPNTAGYAYIAGKFADYVHAG